MSDKYLEQSVWLKAGIEKAVYHRDYSGVRVDLEIPRSGKQQQQQQFIYLFMQKNVDNNSLSCK